MVFIFYFDELYQYAETLRKKIQSYKGDSSLSDGILENFLQQYMTRGGVAYKRSSHLESAAIESINDVRCLIGYLKKRKFVGDETLKYQ
jgi:hypothetical protein